MRERQKLNEREIKAKWERYKINEREIKEIIDFKIRYLSAIVSIEKQFQIPSKISGLMVSAGDFGYIPSVVFVSYLGGKVIEFVCFNFSLFFQGESRQMDWRRLCPDCGGEHAHQCIEFFVSSRECFVECVNFADVRRKRHSTNGSRSNSIFKVFGGTRATIAGTSPSEGSTLLFVLFVQIFCSFSVASSGVFNGHNHPIARHLASGFELFGLVDKTLWILRSIAIESFQWFHLRSFLRNFLCEF